MNQILRCDWLPERARWSYLARSGLLAVSRKKNFTESHFKKKPLIGQACSVMAWFLFACLQTSTPSRSINTQKKNLIWPISTHLDEEEGPGSILTLKQSQTVVYELPELTKAMFQTFIDILYPSLTLAQGCNAFPLILINSVAVKKAIIFSGHESESCKVYLPQ